jgi:Cu2+-exporting ATPase
MPEHDGPAAAPDHSDHDRHEGHSVAMFRDKFWLSLVLTVPVLIWISDLNLLFGYLARKLTV